MVTWKPLNNSSSWNGIGLGYEVQYRLKQDELGSWFSVMISGVSNSQYVVTSLLKYSIHEFKVAGRTSIGSGFFSEIEEERTMEDGMQFTNMISISVTNIY